MRPMDYTPGQPIPLKKNAVFHKGLGRRITFLLQSEKIPFF